MKKFKRVFYECGLWMKSLLYLFYWFFNHIFKSDLKNHIKIVKQGETIDIIVNGPSFTEQQEIVKNDGFDKCMVNYAANTPIFWELKPTYYCISDPHFFKRTYKSSVQEFLTNINKVDWDITIFVTYYAFKHYLAKSTLINNNKVKIIPFHSTPLPYTFKFKHLAYKLFKGGQAMPDPSSVSIPTVMNIINSGYSNINLYGFDHDWIHNVVVDNKNQVCLYDTHYYNEKGEYIPWLKNETETFRMYEVLQTQVELFESYWFIKEYVDYLGNVKVINKSPNSLLDAFDRD